jgi:hypothetical protein
MDAPHTPASAERRAFSEAGFHSWLGEEGTPALISESHDRYYAYCFKFDVAGTGETKEQAIDEVTRLLMRYLVVSYLDGCSYEDTKNTPPLDIRLRTSYLALRSKLRGISAPLSRMGGLISVPTDAAGHSAHPVPH